MKAWILVANASEAYLYVSENLRTKDLNLLKTFSHPESREKGNELITDRRGHYKTSHTARGAFENSSKPKQVEAENFARELSEFLKNGNYKHDYEQLVVVASPHFYGLLHKHMDFSLDNLSHIAKDYTHLVPKGKKRSLKKLTENLRQHLFELA